jgi:hypothetical protein
MDCPPNTPPAQLTPSGPRSCASCDQTACHMNALHRVDVAPDVTTCYILDDVWPEYTDYLAKVVQPKDTILAPGMIGKARISRYEWTGAIHHASWQTALRHIRMRRVAKASGGIRQAAYLKSDAQIAAALAKAIPIESRHLVIAQSWLPFLAELGVLGGRSYDVLMQRYPFANIHQTLDDIAQTTKDSRTISDFRAPEALVRIEGSALAGARRIITPHHGIAALFPQQAQLLNWRKPRVASTVQHGKRTAFIGPALTRHRPEIARHFAQNLTQPLIIYGDAGRSDLWEGVPIECRIMGPDWLHDIGTIIHPAPMVNQPRKLLEAVSAGVIVHASEGCGLDPADYTQIMA